MVEAYCKLIIAGWKNFSDVREEFKDTVEARLKELGYDTDGKKID